MADLGLTDTEIKRVMAEADVNGDGEVGYHEFVPLAVDLVQALYAKAEAAQQLAEEEERAAEAASEFMLHGMTREELEQVMKEVFMKADVDSSGVKPVQQSRGPSAWGWVVGRWCVGGGLGWGWVGVAGWGGGS